jgi:TolB-like protein
VAAALAAAALVASGGCASTVQYVNASADLSTIKAVAVLPFENVSGDKLGAERSQRIFLTELLSLGVFDPVEPGQVARALRSERVDPAAMASDEIKKLGKALGVQGIFLGTLVEYEEGRGGGVGAQITIQLRLLDVESGKTVWSTSRTANGTTVSGRLFGMGAKTATEVVQALIREELGKLVR